MHFDIATNRLYINSHSNSALRIFDVQNETVLILIDIITTVSEPRDLKEYMKKIYISDIFGNLHIYNKTNSSLIKSMNVCEGSIIIDSINFDLCHGSLMHTCRTQNRFQYQYRDGTHRSITTSGNINVLFFDYRRRLWIQEGTMLRIFN
jgi:Ni,Fe-hydrogenase maturation factor